MNFFKVQNIWNYLPKQIPFFNSQNNSSSSSNGDEKLTLFNDLFSKIEETTPNKIKDSDKNQILEYLYQYLELFDQQEKSDSFDQNLSQQIESQEQQIVNILRKLKSDMPFSFLYDQFIFIKNNKYHESCPFVECLSNQDELNQKASYLTQINFSSLYSLTQQECSQQFQNGLNTQIALKNLSERDILQHFINFYFDLIIDLLYRRIPLTTMLKQVQQLQKIECLQKLNISNILALVFERLNLLDKINLGQILSLQYQSIPIFYKLKENEENQFYKNNLICAFNPLMDQIQNHFVLNIWSSTIQKKQREEFFNYLANNKDIISDLKDGYNQRGTIHLYSQFPNSNLNNFMLIDTSQLDLFDVQFIKLFKNLINCTSVILLHLNFEKDFILCSNKFCASEEVQKIINLLDQKYFVILIIHKAQKHRNQLQKYFQKYLEYHKFEYELLITEESDSECQYHTLFSNLTQKIFKKEKKQEIIESCQELLEFYISKSGLQNLQTNVTEYKNIIQQKIKEQLKNKNIGDNEQHKLIQFMFSYSNMFSELFYQEKIFDNLSRNYFKETENFIKKGEKLQLLKKQFESYNQLNQITLFFFEQITQNNHIKQAVISKILSDWKQPLVEENNKRIDSLNQDIRNLEKITFKFNQSQDQKQLEQLYKQKNQLIILQDNYDISIESFIREISLFTENAQRNQQQQIQQNAYLKSQILKYYISCFERGIPIQFIDKTRKFGSQILEEFFKEIDLKFKLQDYKIVSVVGPQSSAKSTLMNYLFRCNFETSSARCTKGMYFTKINLQGMNLIVIDTEGLLSNIFRDQSFDNSVMTLLFLISNVIVFNIKDESNSKMKEMMNITEEVIKLFNNMDENYTVPEIFIALRDYFDRGNIEIKKKQIINEMIQVNGIFESQSSKQQNKNQIKLKGENIFIFPSAFSELNHYQSRFKHINTGFGEDVLKLRQSIVSVLQRSKGYLSIQDFYQKAEQIWTRLMEHGHDLLKCITMEEYKSKKKLEEIAVDYQKKIEAQKIQILEQKEEELKKSLTSNFQDDSSYNRIKQEYDQFIVTQNQLMNQELETQLQKDYNDNKLINQISPRDFNFILNKIQHRNKVNLQVRQNIFEQRIQKAFFGFQIDTLEKDFNKQIQLEINKINFEQNEQTLKKLIDQIQDKYEFKIQNLQKKFETTDELMRQQLEQLKNEYAKLYDEELQNLIQEFSISQIEQQNFQELNYIIKNIIEENQQNAKKFLKDSKSLELKQKEDFNQQIKTFFKGLIQFKFIQTPHEQDIVKNIFQQMLEYSRRFFDQIEPSLRKHINKTNFQKYTFYILYRNVKEQIKNQQKKSLTKKMEKFQKIVDQKIQYIKKMSDTSTNWVELGVEAMRNIQNKIVRTFISKSLSNMEPIMNKIVDDLTSDYTTAINNAFNSVYDSAEQKIKIDNFLKYTVNINRFIDEMKRDQIQLKANELVDNKTTEFNLGLQNIINDLNKTILLLINTTDFNFDQLIEQLNLVSFGDDSLQLGQEIIIENLQNKPQFIEEEEEIEDENQNQDSDEDEEEEEEPVEIETGCNQEIKNEGKLILDHLENNEPEDKQQEEEKQQIQENDETTLNFKTELVSNQDEEKLKQKMEQISFFTSSQSNISIQDKNKDTNISSFIMEIDGSVTYDKHQKDQILQVLDTNKNNTDQAQLNNRLVQEDEDNKKSSIQEEDKSQKDEQKGFQVQEKANQETQMQRSILLEDEPKRNCLQNDQNISLKTEQDQDLEQKKSENITHEKKEIDQIQEIKQEVSEENGKNLGDNQEQDNKEQENIESENKEKNEAVDNFEIKEVSGKILGDNQIENLEQDKKDEHIKSENKEKNETDEIQEESGKNLGDNLLVNQSQDKQEEQIESENKEKNEVDEIKEIKTEVQEESDKNLGDSLLGNQEQQVESENKEKNKIDEFQAIKLELLRESDLNQGDKKDLQIEQKNRNENEQQYQDKTSEQQIKNVEHKQKQTKLKKIKIRKIKKQIPVQQLYIQGMRKVYDEINPSNSDKVILQFKDELANEMEEMLKLHYQKMIGCQERCPFCGQKCHLELGHSGDHSVQDRHLIIGIHGYTKLDSYVDKFCYDTIDEPFRINLQRYLNMFEASQKLFPNWSSCFSLDKKDNYDKNFSQILKQGYALTANWFKNYNNKRRLANFVANVSQEYKDLAQNQEEIDEKYIIQWKYQDEKSNDQSGEKSEDEEYKKIKIFFFKFLSLLLDD